MSASRQVSRRDDRRADMKDGNRIATTAAASRREDVTSERQVSADRDDMRRASVIETFQRVRRSGQQGAELRKVLLHFAKQRVDVHNQNVESLFVLKRADWSVFEVDFTISDAHFSLPWLCVSTSILARMSR